MKIAIAASLLCVWFQQTQTPIFRGTTDVVVANVQVTSRDGRPIAGLTAADFMLKVDGRPRPIASVEFQRIDDARAAVVEDSAGSTLSAGSVVTAQSFVMFVVVPSLMRPESSRPLFDQAAEFLTTLPAAHAVGVTISPARRAQYPFGSLRQSMAQALKNQLGTLGPMGLPSWADTSETMSTIESAISALEAVEGRRTILLFSDVLPSADSNPQSRPAPWFEELLRRALDRNIVIHTIATAAPAIADASRHTSATPLSSMEGLLPMPSDVTGGLYLVRGSNRSAVLPQIAAALSAQYLLTFNVEPQDKDGKSHKIDLKVERKGVEVRSRREFVR